MSRLRSLGWLEWRVILQSLLLLPVCAWRLRTQGFARTHARSQIRCTEASELSPDEQRTLARRIARGVNIAAGYGPYRANCLKRSLVLATLLRRRGIECELKLGADPRETFGAHAWVEHAGEPVNETAGVTARFAPFSPDIQRHHRP